MLPDPQDFGKVPAASNTAMPTKDRCGDRNHRYLTMASDQLIAKCLAALDDVRNWLITEAA